MAAFRVEIKTKKELTRVEDIYTRAGYKKTYKDREALPRSLFFYTHTKEVTRVDEFNKSVYLVPEVDVVALRSVLRPKKRNGSTRNRAIVSTCTASGAKVEYSNVKEASQALSVASSHIYSCAAGLIKTAYGFRWEYLD